MNRFSEKAKHLDSYQSIVDIFKFFHDKKKKLSNGKLHRSKSKHLIPKNLSQANDSVFHVK